MTICEAKADGATVVVVNDHVVQLDLLSGLLWKEGITTALFHSAEEALSAMDPGNPPSLIVTDLYMPGIDGWRFCRLLRSPEYPTFNQVPILVVSAAFAGEEATRITADLGANAFMPSPVDGKRFVEHVHALLSGDHPKDRLRALIVEDSRALAGILGKTFETQGWQVNAAFTLDQGVAALDASDWDLAVIDYHLPDGKGDALLAQIESHSPDCVCIMMTTDPSPELALTWMKQGAAAYVRKPFEPAYLLELVARARRERTQLRVKDILETRTRQLLENAALLSETQKMAHVGTWQYDVAADRFTCSDEVYRIFGLEPQEVEVAYETFIQAVHPDDRAAVKAAYSKCLADGSRDHEVDHSVIQTRTGDMRHVHQKCTHVRDAGGKIVRIIGMIQDITRRKRTEMTLERKSSERRLLLDTLPVQVWYLTDIDTYGALNMAHADFLGFHPKDIAYKRLEEFTSRDVAEVCRVSNRDVFDSRQPVHTEEWIPNAQGENRLIAITKIPRLDHEKNVEWVVCTGVDITEMRNAEMLLRQSEERFRHIFDLAPMGIELYDGEGRLIVANPACHDIFGIEDEETVLDFPLFDDPNLDESLKHKLRQGEMVEYDVAFDFEKVRAAGLYRTRKKGISRLHVIITPMRQPEELAPIGYLVLINDITDRIFKEDQIKESQERLRMVIEGTRAGTWEWYVQTGEAVFNERWAEILGYTLEDLQPISIQTWIDLCHAGDMERSNQLLEDHFSGKHPYYECECRMRHKEGQWVWIKDRGKVVRWSEAGKPLLMTGTHVDITDRKKAEQALRESEERYRELVEDIDDVAFTIDHDGIITYLSPAVKQLSGDEASAFIGSPFLDFIHPDDRDRIAQEFTDALSGHSEPSEYRLVNRSGDIRWVRSSSRRILKQGRAVGTRGVLVDITESKRLQEQIQEIKKMEAIATLAGGIAHQFNNALTPILGHIELLEMDRQQDEDTLDVLGKMKMSGRRMVDLTRQLLAYARGGKYRLRILSLSDIVSDTISFVGHTLNPEVQIETDLPPDVPAIRADPTQVEMVLSALIANANEAIEAPGRIRISVRGVELDEAFRKAHAGLEPGPYVRLTVEDSGKGMNEETLNRIFDPFFTTHFLGRGLGMAAVYGIVKNHHGAIAVESAVGKGTVVRIYLPAAPPEPKGPEAKARIETAPESLPSTMDKVAILVIEDEPIIMEVTRDALERLGCRVLEAYSGQQAVEMAETFDGDIGAAILDLKLPDMSGREVYPLIKTARPDLKVIVCSGYSIDGPAREIMDAGADAFIQKPFSLSGLRAALKQVLS